MAYDLSSVEKRIEFGTYWENYLLTKLNDKNLNFKKAVNKYSFFDFIRKDTNIPIIIELNNNNEDVYLICNKKIESYRKLLLQQPKTRFIYVYNQVIDNDNFEMTYYEINMKLLDNYEFYISEMKHTGKYYIEVPKRLFTALKDDYTFLK
jgi:hypothetical protein